MLEALAATMATQTTGYIAIIDGVMNPATFHMHMSAAARAALIVKLQKYVVSTCADPDCDCLVNLLAEKFPDVKIVPVDVTERKA